MNDKPDLDIPDLEQEMDRLQARMPHRIARVMGTLRGPAAAPYRIPLGVALTVGGCLSFLPVLGLWMAPLGLTLMAQDVPVIRKPLARAMARINRKLD